MGKSESAELILKLYDLRREPVMRKARDWMFTFHPESAEHYSATMMDPEVGGYLRMVTSYWDMAASLVDALTHLSDREREVLQHMAEGLTKKEIATALDLSIHTVDNYLRRIYKKLHVNTLQGAVARALKEGLL